ncbi:DHH family phosphoesterase [Chloroflexi bacterium TSY]|nr:DHH family phosphoesterase [Chloroflexi bacterium TSY]
MMDTSLVAGLHRATDILCVSHIAPDGDAVGSLLGMGWILRKLQKKPVLALEDNVPENLRQIPGAETIVHTESILPHYDLIVCLDASSADRMGAIYQPQNHATIPLYVIDHHVTNTHFGTINWVDPTCAATCQMLVELADALHVSLEGPLAQCLLTGLVTDTLCFRTSNTNAAVLKTASRLIEGGATLATITEQILNRRPYNVLQLWGSALSNAQLEDGVIWVTISQNQMNAIGNPTADLQLSSTLLTAAEANVSASFRETKDDAGNPAVICSFRARPGYNVADLALELGGGGHPGAAGCQVAGVLEEVAARIVTLLKMAANSDGSK